MAPSARSAFHSNATPLSSAKRLTSRSTAAIVSVTVAKSPRRVPASNAASRRWLARYEVATWEEMRGNLLDVLRSDYVRTARAKGLSEGVVLSKHAVRNAINPLITLFGYSLSDILTGSFLVEVVMSLPGLGRTTIQAFFDKDLFLVTASVLVATLMLVLGNAIADILLAVTDPRISYKSADSS